MVTNVAGLPITWFIAPARIGPTIRAIALTLVRSPSARPCSEGDAIREM